MIRTALLAGAVVRCAYRSARRTGSLEGDEVVERPAVVLAVLEYAAFGEIEILVLPVTATPPKRPWEAVAIPFAERRGLGLEPGPAWIVTAEANLFVGPLPDPGLPFAGPAQEAGRCRLSPALLARVARSFRDNSASQRSGPLLETAG